MINIFFDLAKAFNTVDHVIEHAILHSRKYMLWIFLVCINDLSRCSLLSIYAYADDTTLSCNLSDISMNDQSVILNSELEENIDQVHSCVTHLAKVSFSPKLFHISNIYKSILYINIWYVCIWLAYVLKQKIDSSTILYIVFSSSCHEVSFRWLTSKLRICVGPSPRFVIWPHLNHSEAFQLFTFHKRLYAPLAPNFKIKKRTLFFHIVHDLAIVMINNFVD